MIPAHLVEQLVAVLGVIVLAGIRWRLGALDRRKAVLRIVNREDVAHSMSHVWLRSY